MTIYTVVSGKQDRPRNDERTPVLLGTDSPPSRNLIGGMLCGDIDEAQRKAAEARKSGHSIAVTTSALKIEACGYRLPPTRSK